MALEVYLQVFIEAINRRRNILPKIATRRCVFYVISSVAKVWDNLMPSDLVRERSRKNTQNSGRSVSYSRMSLVYYHIIIILLCFNLLISQKLYEFSVCRCHQDIPLSVH